MGRSVAPLNRLVPAVALLLAAAAVGTTVLLRDDDPTAAVGDALRIVYAVEDVTTQERTVEVVEVERPVRSRRLAGDNGSATTDEGVFDRVDGRWRQVAVVPPGEVGADLRLPAALSWAEGHLLASRDGTGTVAGRRCTWWLTREPLDIAVVAPATAADRTRSCVDAAGLLLADNWRSGGRDLRRRTATEVHALDAVNVFDGATPAPLQAGLVLTVVRPQDGPADDLVVLAAPPGLTLEVAVQFGDLDPGTKDVVRRTVRTVYAGQGELVVVDQVRGPAEARGVPVAVSSLGSGRAQATGGGIVVTVPLGPDQLLRVRSSLPYDELIAWLSSVRRR